MRAVLILLVLLISFNIHAKTYHMLSLGLVLPAEGSTEDGEVTNSSSGRTKFDPEYQFDSAFSLGYEFRIVQAHSWGWAAGIEMNTAREILEYTLSYDPGSQSFIYNDPLSIQTNIVYLNAIYQWQQFYVPFGINFSNHKPQNFVNEFEDLKIKGKLGVNFTLGVLLSEHHFIELDVKVTTFEYKNKRTRQIGGTTEIEDIKYTMHLPFASLRYKYAF